MLSSKVGGRPPVIIIGMHRSGTSAITRILEQLGIFVGHDLDENHESQFFQGLNKWLLSQSSGAWDNPGAISHLLGDGESVELVLAYLREIVCSPRRRKYVGLRKYLLRSDKDTLSRPWGWKDPRSTFTLPIWLQLYPNAKIIYVERHGIDVAVSLKRRNDGSFRRSRERFGRMRGWYWLRPKRGGFAGSVRCRSLDGAFSLWEEYVQRGRRHVQELGPDRALSIRYENLLETPSDHLALMAAFCGVSPTREQLDETAATLKPERMFAYRTDPSLLQFAQSMKGRLLGYDV